MDIAALGAIGELVGGLAVVASLLYVGAQIKQNSALSLAATTSDALNQSAELSQAIAVSKETAALFFKGIDDHDGLDADERSQFFFVMMSFMRRYENSEFQARQGLLPQAALQGFFGNLRALAPRRGFQSWWERAEAGFSQEFRAEVNAMIREASPS